MLSCMIVPGYREICAPAAITVSAACWKITFALGVMPPDCVTCTTPGDQTVKLSATSGVTRLGFVTPALLIVAMAGWVTVATPPPRSAWTRNQLAVVVSWTSMLTRAAHENAAAPTVHLVPVV